MADEISPDEAVVRIPRVCIIIPGVHSRVKLEPRYVLPLVKAIWKDQMRDPTDSVRIIDMPPNLPEAELYRVLPADSAARMEESRLRAEFGLNPRTQEPWFDHVYPGENFQTAFDVALKDAVHSPAGASPADVLAGLEGVDKAGAQKLLHAGITTILDVAKADQAKLTKILGKKRGEQAREDALFRVSPREPDHGPNPDIDDKIAAVVPQADDATTSDEE